MTAIIFSRSYDTKNSNDCSVRPQSEGDEQPGGNLEAIGKQSGSNLEAIWCQRCPGATKRQSEGPKLGLERKCAKTIVFLVLSGRDLTFRLHFGGVGVTVCDACAQK